jgi:membrane protease YdiL (CAAX protease family)
MKFHQLFTLFIVLIFLVFPPTFVTQQNNIASSNYIQDANNFSIFTVLTCLIWSIFLFIVSGVKENKLSRNSFRFSLISFIIILYISIILNQVKILFDLPQNDFIYNLTKNQKILSCIQIVVLCIYEEILYRKFLHKNFKSISHIVFEKLIKNHESKIIEKLPNIISIFLLSVLFALAHLYSGFIDVIFAFLASLVFSICYEKTKNIIFPIIAHTMYNLLIFLTLTKF